MTEPKSLPRMAFPLVISFTLRFMFSLVDLVFAALIAKEDNSAVAAIGLFAPIQFVFIAIWVGLSGGFTASLSQAFGNEDEARIGALKRTMLRVLGWLVPILASCGVALWFVIPSLGLEPALTSAFRIYATTLVIGMPLTGFWSIYPDSIVKAHQETRTTMIAGLLSSVTNIALNSLFALVFQWGLFGIALATVVSRFPALFYAQARATKLERRRCEQRWEPKPATWAPPLASILRLALPGAVTFLLGAAESGVVNRLLASLQDSTTAIATYAVYDRLLLLALMPASATAVAVVPFVARLLPSGACARIRADLWRTLLLIAGLALTFSVLVGWVFAEPVTGFLIKQGPNAKATPIGLDVIRLLPLGALVLTPFLVLRPVFEAANRPQLGVRVSFVRYLVLAIPLAFLATVLAPRWDLDPLTTIVGGLILAGGLASAFVGRLAFGTLQGGGKVS